MIKLTRINGKEFAMNPFLIEIIEELPDTTIKLLNGNRYIVEESGQEVSKRFADFLGVAVSRKINLAPVDDCDGDVDD